MMRESRLPTLQLSDKFYFMSTSTRRKDLISVAPKEANEKRKFSQKMKVYHETTYIIEETI